MERVRVRLDALGIPFERIEAIDDTRMDPAEYRRGVSRFWWWCCSLRPIMRGQVGCALSHQKVYRKMIAEDLPHACVLEDDVIPDDRFPQVLDWLDGAMDDTRAQVALMCDHSEGRPRSEKKAQKISLTRVEDAMYAEGYVLTQKAARQILKANYPLRVAADIWGRWTRQERIELYLVRPTVCSQTSVQDGNSTISLVGFERRNLSWWGRRWWDFRRVVGVTLDAFSGIPEFRGAMATVLGKFR